MSFLAPLFLLGALAVALPLLFHLIRQTTREKRPFSSLMFLQPTPPRVTRRSRLEHVFLLVLRCLAICLLALGFARPFFAKPVPIVPQNAADRQTILLVDASASMRREGLWPAALAKAGAVLQAASPDDRVAVLAFDRQVQSVAGFEQWTATETKGRAALALEKLKTLSPGWSSTHLGNALIQAAELLSQADDTAARARRIVLVTDFQEGSHLDGLQGYDWPRGIEVVVEPLKAKRPTNAGVQWVADVGDNSSSAAEGGVRLRISNSSDARREQFQIRWDGVAAAPPVEVYVPPGQSRIVQAPALPAGVEGERLVLAGDDEAFDNTVFVLRPKPEQVTVLFWGDEAAEDPTQSLYYVRRAFQQTRGQMIQIKAIRSQGAPAARDLAAARLMIAGDSLPQERIATARQFLQDGGTVFFVMKEPGSGQRLGQLAGVEGLAASEAAVSGYAMLGQIDFEHPLFAPFADPRYSDFTKIHFWKHRRLAPDALPGVRVLARFDSGDPALLEVPSGRGRLLVLTSGWHPTDSQLALSSKFVPLLYSLLEQSGGSKAPVAQYHIGDNVDLPPTTGNQPWTVRKPDGTIVPLAINETRFAPTLLPGIYTATCGETSLRFAVNLHPAESRTAPLSLEDLERLGVPLRTRDPQPVPMTEQQQKLRRAELENHLKLWWWLIAAALVILVVETCLAAWLTRRSAPEAEGQVDTV